MLREMMERECRFHDEINFDGSISDNAAVFMNHSTFQRIKQEINSLHEGLFIGPFRVFIDYRVADGTVQLSFD